MDNGDALIERLDGLRLEKDWSYRRLSTEMARRGWGVSAQTLHQLLSDRSVKPYDRTLNKIEKYFENLDAENRRKRA